MARGQRQRIAIARAMLKNGRVFTNSKLPFGGVKNSGNYRPAAVSTVDFCVYQSAGLLVKDDEGESLDNIKGLQL